MKYMAEGVAELGVAVTATALAAAAARVLAAIVKGGTGCAENKTSLGEKLGKQILREGLSGASRAHNLQLSVL